jgi:hypothetical protein
MNSQIVDALTRGVGDAQNRRSLLAAVAAMTLASAPLSPVKAAKKQKSCNKVRRKALKEAGLKCEQASDLRCQVQVPRCETGLSTVCQPGPNVQECLDDTSACCQLLATCDPLAAMECVVARFIVG